MANRPTSSFSKQDGAHVVTIHGNTPEAEDPQAIQKNLTIEIDRVAQSRYRAAALEPQVQALTAQLTGLSRQLAEAQRQMAGEEEIQRRGLEDVKRWGSLALRHPVVHKPIEASPKAPSYSDSIAQASGYVDAADANRKGFLAALSDAQRKAIEADTAALDKACALVCSGQSAQAFALVGEITAAAKADGKKASS